MTQEQLKNRIKDKMRDYVYANTGPYAKPRQRKLTDKVIKVPLEEVENELTVDSCENAVFSLHAIKQVLNKQEQEILAYRLSGYKVGEISKVMMLAPKTIEKYLTHIKQRCKEVNNA